MPTPSNLTRLAWPVILVALIVASLPLRGADKRIVLIAGKPSHPPGMHEFRAGSLLIQKALASVPGITVQVYDSGWPSKIVDGARVDDNAALDNADAVLIFADGGKGHPAIQGDHIKVLDALAARGVGLGFAHYGVEVPAGAPGDAMHRWVGGYYETTVLRKPDVEAGIRHVPDPPDHPRRRAVCDARRVVLQHAVDAGRGREGARLTPILVATPSDEVRKGPYVIPAALTTTSSPTAAGPRR